MNNKIKIEKISSLQNSFIKNLYKDSRLNNGKVIILNFFKSLIEYGELKFDYLLCTNDWYMNNQNLINSNFSKIIIVNKEIINKLSFVKTSSEVLGITNHKYNEVNLNQKNIIILEDIKDPNNMASIIRTAIAFNIFNFYITKNSVSPYNEKVIRGTVGSFIFANITIVDDLLNAIKHLENKKFKIFATILDKNAIELSQIKFDEKNAIIFGNEARGISSKIKSIIKNNIYIDINNIDSLNVASAASITLYQLSKDIKCKK